MARYTDFTLPSGAVVHVQSSLAPPDEGPVVRQASGADKLRETWADGVGLVREMASGIVEQLREATRQAEEVTVEFGVNISSKAGVILVEGEASANLKVTIAWKRGD
jgi:hypothetical protein